GGQTVEGKAFDTLIDGPGNQLITSGGTAFRTVINGGEQDIEGGTAIGTIVNASSYQNVFGIAHGTTINSGGEADVYNVAEGTIVNGGNQFIFPGGSATATILNEGGYEDVVAGGSTNHPT